MTLTYWRCLGIPPHTPPCDAAGSYPDEYATGAAGPAHAHTTKTGHSTNATAREWGEA